MWMLGVLVLFFNLCEGVIYKLSDEEYNRMPPLFRVDDFDTCFQSKDGVYCNAEIDLVSDQPSELLEMITEYSAHYRKHYNYTHLKYGICLSHCENYDPTKEWSVSLESCLNSSLWESHGLKTKVVESKCRTSERRWDITTADICVGVFIVVLITLNIAGTACDYLGYNNDRLSFLQYFSVLRNWRQLVAPAQDGPDLRLAKLKPLYGIKTIISTFVIIAHALIPVVLFIENTSFVEDIYGYYVTHTIINGTSLVKSLFIVSGFLLIYTLLISMEGNEITWKIVPQIILLRWLRLLPTHAFLLALTSTWVRFAGTGPLWDIYVTEEQEQCKKNWWKNLLYINNYDDDSNCYPHGWYLGCDMQFTIIGTIIFVASKMYNGDRYRYKMIASLLAISIIIMITNIYYYDLDGILLVTPRLAVNMFMNDDNFNLMYKRGHTNLFKYALGMWMGYLIYDVQKKNIDVQKYKKYKLLYWSQVPLITAIYTAGFILFNDGPRLPLVARIIYGLINRALVGVMLMVLIAGMILEYEGFYRRFMEWSGWTPLGRISYCSYLVHTTVLRTYVSTYRKINLVTFTWMILNLILMIFMSFVAAALLWLFVEAPFSKVIKRITRPKNTGLKNEANDDVPSEMKEERNSKKKTQ